MEHDVIAAVIAAGRWKGEIPPGTSPWRALAPLNGRPMLAYVLDALRESRGIKEAILVGPPELSEHFPDLPRLDPTDTLTGNVFAASRYAQGKGHVMLVGSDIPLITPEAIDGFIKACDFDGTRLFYSIVEKQVCLQKYPQMKRTYVRLRDGTYTGGNLMLAEPQFFLDRGPQITAIYDARKSPLRLAQLLGLQLMTRTILTAFCRLPLLDVATASKLVGRALKDPVKGVPIPFAEVGADLDSQEEIPVFEAILAKR